MLISLKRKTPVGIKILLKKIRYFGFKYYCNSCKSHIQNFHSGGIDSEVINKLKIVGAGFHEVDYCPICKASYRQRLQMLYLEEQKEPKPNHKLLHIAPEECLYNYFKKRLKKNYICGDLEPERYSFYANPIKIDLTAINFTNDSFDIVVCNHVLEHIVYDRKAINEIFRILRPNGFALLQVPISLKISETYEDQNIRTPQERLEKFGQKDHVRVYAMDYIARLEGAGFIVEVIPATHYSNSKNYNKIALDPRENLFICRKK